MHGEQIRVRGLVQGVGFRPTVWRLASQHQLTGQVSNDGEGVLIQVWGYQEQIENFLVALVTERPPLARIDSIERDDLGSDLQIPEHFQIAASHQQVNNTSIAPDAAVCPACLDDSLNPFSRRYRYPLTNCTHCGPRLSIIHKIPYDRSNTSMAAFELCDDCREEYHHPTDRRFHAQPNACHRCGPKTWLERCDGRVFSLETLTQLDDVDATCTLLQQGEIIAIKGIGGFHLACDATNDDAVQRLRERKNRYTKPFALMARDVDVIRQYCHLSELEQSVLSSAEAPIVLLEANGETVVSPAIAPRQRSIGFMLPYTPLHHLILRRMQRPIVLTSGNLSEEPQCIDNDDARQRLKNIADYLLLHDRDIVHRVDDSVLRIMAGQPQLLRRARGYAPVPMPLPKGLEQAPELLALGSELKNTFCLLKNAQAIVSQHIGDLEDAKTYADYRVQLEHYAGLFDHQPEHLVIDQHPEYLSSKLGIEWAQRTNIGLSSVQHHHAHIAACLAENNISLDHSPVLGVALDGLGYGEDGALWGGEFLLADYAGFERLGTFKPVAMLGGAQAMREPWRNTLAHLLAEMGWPAYRINYESLELTRFLDDQPLETFQTMLKNGINSPLASSCGRLFDAVAAAIGLCREHVQYEGQAAMELESCVDMKSLDNEDDALAYPFAIPRLNGNGLPYIEPLSMWQAVLGDLILQTPRGVIAARFHKGLAKAIVTMVDRLCTRNEQRFVDTVALSGGVFQNKILLEQVKQRLEMKDFQVLTHHHLPANDGGLSLGQAVVAAARTLQSVKNQEN
ncbi:MAG TPA: carbamoyltransferase HypF [Crenotrichaceae bacterium]|nr:carbamoyltransferase HypF [Crenotrichaceae bacterium]